MTFLSIKITCSSDFTSSKSACLLCELFSPDVNSGSENCIPKFLVSVSVGIKKGRSKSLSRPSNVYCFDVLLLTFALASILGRNLAVADLEFALEPSSLFFDSRINRLLLIAKLTSSSILLSGIFSSKSSLIGAISVISLPTIELSSSKLIS